MVLEELKYSLLHPIKVLQLLYNCHLQNEEFARIDITAEKLIVFIVPGKNRISGGVMSIFSLVTSAKKIKDVHQSEVILVTCPGFRTYFKNKFFISRERAFRFSQIRQFGNLKKIVVHLPEILVNQFYDSLSEDDKAFFSSIGDVHINILNQNIELMPNMEGISSLRRISDKITQTTAHDQYSNQTVCNRFQIPLHHFSVFIDLTIYPRINFKNKEKIIVLSPDKRDCRNKIIKMLRSRLPDYKLVTVRNMSFADYMLLVAKARFSLTFGEGFDGYLIHPIVVGSLSFAVYNKNFFPDGPFMEMGNIYANYDDLIEKIADDIRELEADEKRYMHLVSKNMEEISRLYSYEGFLHNQKKFYLQQYDYYPKIDS